MRIAFFGPLNPTPSGISDYDEELIPHLRKRYDIDVYVDRHSSSNGVYHHGYFFFQHRQKPYDLNLYQMGNGLIHEYMYAYLFAYPGATVFHDYCLHHSRARMLNAAGYADRYREEARYAHPESPELPRLGTALTPASLLFYEFPFIRLPLISSLAAAAHSDFVVERLSGCGTPVVKIPMHVEIRNEAEESLYPEKIVIASFGLATPEKRIVPALDAIKELRGFYDNIVYLIVGETVEHLDLEKEVSLRKLNDIVKIYGRVDTATFHQLMRRSDIVINLRYPSARETSATLLRAMAYGKAVMASRLLHTREIPDDVVVKIRPENEVGDIYQALWQLIENESYRHRIGEKARKYFQQFHSREAMLNGYHQLIETAMRRKTEFRRPPLPLHLQDADTILRDYITRTSFGGKETDLVREVFNHGGHGAHEE